MGIKIFMAVCFVPIAFLMFGILYYEGMRKGNILFGVTLWPGAKEDNRVLGVQRYYKRTMQILLWVCLGLLAASCLPGRSSISQSLQMLWLMLVIVIFFIPHFTANRRLREMKQEWRTQARETGVPSMDAEEGAGDDCGADHSSGELAAEAGAGAASQRHVDVTAASRPQPRPFWKGGFLGGLLGFVPVIGELFLAGDSFFGWWSELVLLSMAAGGLALLWVMYNFWRMRTDVVSWHSEVNQQVARVRQYQWGRFWCLAVWENSLFLFVIWYGMHRPHQLFWVVVAGTLVLSVLLLVQMVLTEGNIRKAYEAYADEAYWNEDEDAHWLGGIIYYNKKDSRFLVNKRVGIGTTVNLAKTSGKVFAIGAGILTAALLLWAMIMLLATDFVPISLKIEEGAVVSRQFGEEYRIPFQEIESAELIGELPSMSKRVGTATETVYKGSFLDKDYHSCQVCVRKGEASYVKLETRDGTTYYLNDEAEENTRAVYQELLLRCYSRPEGP